MHIHLRRITETFLEASITVLVPASLAAQVAPTAKATSSNDTVSKWDIFWGYSYLAPKGTVNGYSYNPVNYGSIMSVTGYFSSAHVGVQFEGDEHVLTPENSRSSFSEPGNDFSGGSIGLNYRAPVGNITPFLHALVGGEEVGSYFERETWGPVITAGGGVDLNTALFNHHLGVRLIQADYQYTWEGFPALGGGTADFNILRLSAGVVLRNGSFAPPPQLMLSCTPSPVTVFPGDPEIVTAQTENVNPKLNAVYSWTGDGAAGDGTAVNIATESLAPGSYRIAGTVKEGKPGKEGRRPWEAANCLAVFTVKAFEPPTASCTASPGTINPGDKSTIIVSGISAQNRPLTYSYSAASGSIGGTGPSAAFDSTGAATGVIAITCNVSDDKGQTATAGTTVTITAPFVPAAPHTQALCSITFDKEHQPPARVDNEAKACLDEIALSLQGQADAKLVVVGASTAEERAPKKGSYANGDDLAAQRAVNSKEYLVVDKGIDASRISVATDSTSGQTVKDYLVPAGAAFTDDVQGTAFVDESIVKPQVRQPLGAAHTRRGKPSSAPGQ